MMPAYIRLISTFFINTLEDRSIINPSKKR